MTSLEGAPDPMIMGADLRRDLAARGLEHPSWAVANGTLMARVWPVVLALAEALLSVSDSGHFLREARNQFSKSAGQRGGCYQEVLNEAEPADEAGQDRGRGAHAE
ncbi:hypothetical protein NUM_23090 [Actinocatenispora comari]|uniref:Uncharacterized protein n=1 Tax=Actinocatenispora comari TaxID=2807577 RepID=A0A8J4EKG1_9ACTN|nr:hypothetical protein NUM_23090 [Actinocatenispora comari]